LVSGLRAFGEHPALMVPIVVAMVDSSSVYVTASIILVPDHFTTSRTTMIMASGQAFLLGGHGVTINGIDLKDSTILVHSVRKDAEALLHRTFNRRRPTKWVRYRKPHPISKT